MKINLYILSAITVVFITQSCTTYLIPVESFKAQFAGLDSSKYYHATVAGPNNEPYYYYSNPIKQIKCFDKNGNPAILINSPSIEIRFTYGTNNRHVTFYFDQIFVNDSCVTGVRSKFIPSIRKTILLKSITKIEIQDGHKKFTYAQ
ncbi:MAG: hypothetical protein NTU51_08390 [Bacteroidetes bacterium]|nr:hypothetical protein [Bacteroidota bacterium]